MRKLLFFGLLLALFFPKVSWAQSGRDLPFSWDNVTVYFLITDRFNNGDPTNDTSFDRQKNSTANELDFQGGDIPGVTQKIREGYFDKLGVSAIWVTPVVENRHGYIGTQYNDYPYHGYHTNDWTAFDPNFTSAEQFEEFIDEAHNHGIRVLVDIVMNHTGYVTYKDVNGQRIPVDQDYPLDWIRLQCQKDGEPNNGELPCDDYSTPLYGLPDIRTESFNEVALPQWLLDKWEVEGRRQQELDELNAYFARTGKPRTPRYYLIKWLTDWVREYGIDGFRVDTERHVRADVWKELKEEAVLALREWKQNNPTKKPDDLDFYMTGEDSSLNIKGNANDPLPEDFTVSKFNSMINFESPKDAYTNMGQEEIFSSFADKLNRDGGFNTQGEYNMISYLRSHDYNQYYTGNMYYGGTTLLLSPGGVQIYYGDESGRQFFAPQTYPDAGYRGFMNWDSLDEGMLFHWRKLGTFRREHTSVGAGSHQKLSDSPYIFKREYNRNNESDKVLVFQGQDGDFTGPQSVYGMWADGTELKDYFSGETAIVSGGTVDFGTAFGLMLVGEPLELTSSVSLSVSPASGLYNSPITVEMVASSTASGATTSIFYTTDNTDPSSASTPYNGSFIIDETTTVKAIAIDSEGNESPIVTRDYVIGDGGPFDVHFKKPSDWSSAYIYIFNQNTGEALPGFPAWPGVEMSTVSNTPWFKYTIDQNVQVGIVFNDNGGAQSDDLTRIKEGWYDNTWSDTCPSDCPGIVIDDPYDIYYKKPSGWNSVFVYLYDKNSNTAIPGFPAWPGVQISAVGNSPWYKYTVNQSVEVGIVFNDNGGAQTDDLFRTTEGWYDNSWFDACPNECPGITTGFDVYFKKPSSWSNAFIYVYDKNANAAIPGAPAWPGVAMNAITGSPWYSYNIDQDVEVGIVFNSGDGSQTDDLFRTTEGWYDNVWSDTCPSECPSNGALRSSASVKTSISENLSLVKAWPNPFTNSLTLSFTGNMVDNDVSVSIYDISGKKTNVSLTKDAKLNVVTINTSSLAEGMYLMKVSSNKNTEVIKIMK
ncbi:starch-binding protein [Aquimarina sp. MMG016]|uniref:starch-binding protein n=1 Tax=Aquimarina sp. MMG016 TaxID=2822690 RepID=UPI001B3A5EFC|nr:starch-binding protein [Aquimarina sp. MMG016]MBQ4822465.1 starch-binding protein [Aquimarina sp. MMG016]